MGGFAWRMEILEPLTNFREHEVVVKLEVRLLCVGKNYQFIAKGEAASLLHLYKMKIT